MERDITIKWHFTHPPEQVWACLTNPELISLWLMKNDFKPVIGHRFNFHTKPIPKMGFDGIVYCEVIDIVPLKKLVYTWKGGPRPGEIKLDMVLYWTLTEKNGGTEVLLEHKGFKGFHNYLASIFMGSGWKKGITKAFAKVLEQYVKGEDLTQTEPAHC